MNNKLSATRISTFFAFSVISLSTLILAACGGGGGTPTYTISGSVTGTSGTGLVLQLNSTNDLNVSGDVDFTFTTRLTSGSSYSVTAFSSPTGQTCRVTNDSGTISANVTNVSVECRTNEDPNGYYINTGSASVGDGASGTLTISDLQAIIYDNRFMASSVSNGLLYDGPMEMFGNELTATVSVYRDGLLIYSNVNVSGTVVAGDSISGNFGGTEEGSGTFQLNHSMDSSTADVARVLRDGGLNEFWTSTLGNSTTTTRFDITLSNITPMIMGYNGPTDGDFQTCRFNTVDGGTPVAIIPISGTSLYRITVQMSLCVNTDMRSYDGTAGHYTGFATSRDDPDTDDTLVFMVSSASGAYAVAEDFK